MIRLVNIAFVAITGLMCLGLYRIAEEARVAHADLAITERSIAREKDSLTVLGAEWARLTAPARIQALASRHLDLTDKPTVEMSSLTQLPRKGEDLVPESQIRTAKVVVPAPKAPQAPKVETVRAASVPATAPLDNAPVRGESLRPIPIVFGNGA